MVHLFFGACHIKTTPTKVYRVLSLEGGTLSEWILTAETACKRDKSHVVVDDKPTNIESITEFVVQ